MEADIDFLSKMSKGNIHSSTNRDGLLPENFEKSIIVFTVIADSMWMGSVPFEERDWRSLEELKISTVFNFSSRFLKRRSGFSIINFPPDIISITMPMTDQEHNMAAQFSHVLALIQDAKMLYICGESSHRDALTLLLCKKRRIRVVKDFSISDEDMLLIRRYGPDL